MYRMLTCFNLAAGASIGEFQQSLDALTEHLRALDLVESSGPIGRRHRHVIMDTDDERDHEYFFLMNFRNLAQCDAAVAYISPGDEPADAIHKAVYARIVDPVFICWEDLQS
jgi:hypothetical protein